MAFKKFIEFIIRYNVESAMTSYFVSLSEYTDSAFELTPRGSISSDIELKNKLLNEDSQTSDHNPLPVQSSEDVRMQVSKQVNSVNQENNFTPKTEINEENGIVNRVKDGNLQNLSSRFDCQPGYPNRRGQRYETHSNNVNVDSEIGLNNTENIVNQTKNNNSHLQKYRMEYGSLMVFIFSCTILTGLFIIERLHFNKYICYASIYIMVVLEYEYFIYLLSYILGSTLGMIARCCSKNDIKQFRRTMNDTYCMLQFVRYLDMAYIRSSISIRIVINGTIIGVDGFINTYFYDSLRMYTWKGLINHIFGSTWSFAFYKIVDLLWQNIETRICVLLIFLLFEIFKIPKYRFGEIYLGKLVIRYYSK